MWVTMTNCRFFALLRMTTSALLLRCAGVEALQIGPSLRVLRVDRGRVIAILVLLMIAQLVLEPREIRA
jgi:hypothetical protein